MTNLTFAPAVTAEFDGSVDASRAPPASRLRGLLSGLVFLIARVPFYLGAAVLAAVACLVGVALFAVQAGLTRASPRVSRVEAPGVVAGDSFGGRHA